MAANPFGLPHHELVQRVVDRIKEAEKAGNQPLYWELRQAAPLVLGCSDRHVRRLVENGGPFAGDRARWEPDDTVMDALARHVVKGRVNRQAAYDHLVETGNAPPISASQFRRRYYDIEAERRGFIEGGPRGRQNREPRIRQLFDRPFGAIYFDGFVNKIWCRPPEWYEPLDGAPLIQATALNVIDHHCRIVPGMPEVVPGELNHTDVRTVFSRAVLETPDWCPAHGVPGEMHWDNATANLADPLTQLLLMIDFSVVSSDPYQPQQNGAVENLHNLLVKRFLAPKPFYTGGRQREDGVVYQPRLEDCPPFEWVRDEYLTFVRDYNESWEIEDRDGKTPLQLWQEAEEAGKCPEPVPEDIAWLLAHGERRVRVNRGTVTVDNNTYVHAVLGPLTGRWVELRNLTEATVDVYDLNGRHLCRAENVKTASDDTWEDVRSARSSRRRIDTDLQKRVTHAHEDELAAIEEQYKPTPRADFQGAVDALGDAAVDAARNTPVEADRPNPPAGDPQ